MGQIRLIDPSALVTKEVLGTHHEGIPRKMERKEKKHEKTKKRNSVKNRLSFVVF